MLTFILAFHLCLTAKAHDYFKVSCDRYLILPDPIKLESETTEDLEFMILVFKARIFMYGSPNDRIWLRFFDNELKMRRIVEEAKADALDAKDLPL